ncbi:ParB/RepB/Spo0J family partition protein [Deinococcus pimensis]|uniref:ParB/RepB/Spo0J family partition protein n=1 Tax=Deinococcus pimensis TaxID=309888 RepID=UPI0004BBF5AA|nr:ParB/RepB/Spo0J family partition protein [Deinococcus pimensis]
MGDRLAGILGATAVAELSTTETRPPRVVPVSSLRSSPFQPRRTFDEAALARLTASVREQGVLQPLLVRPSEGGYEIVAGERRWRAATAAGLQEVPVEVRELSDAQASMLAAVENLQREDLGVIDEVDATLTLVAGTLGVEAAEARSRLNALLRRPDEDPEAVALLEGLFTQLGRGTWQSFTKNKVRVLNWPPEVLTAMRERGLGYTVAGVVAGAPAEHRDGLLERALAGATREELRAELAGRSFRKEQDDRARRVARNLTSARALAGLDARRRARLGKLLAELDTLFGEG